MVYLGFLYTVICSSLLSQLTKQSRKRSFPFSSISLVTWMWVFCSLRWLWQAPISKMSQYLSFYEMLLLLDIVSLRKTLLEILKCDNHGEHSVKGPQHKPLWIFRFWKNFQQFIIWQKEETWKVKSLLFQVFIQSLKKRCFIRSPLIMITLFTLVHFTGLWL